MSSITTEELSLYRNIEGTQMRRMFNARNMVSPMGSHPYE